MYHVIGTLFNGVKVPVINGINPPLLTKQETILVVLYSDPELIEIRSIALYGGVYLNHSQVETRLSRAR